MKICTACGVEYADSVLFCQRDGTPLRSADQSKDLVGQIVAERYHVTRKLGEGGMGQVYLAEHVKMGRRCAIKIMSAGMINDPDAVSRFNREAANASRITHPNVCAIYDFGETSDRLIYLAMEYIEGQSLSDLLHDTGALSLPRAGEILAQCASALQAAHDLGIVHRDLKPDNIMVITSRAKDVVKVVDFGIAKATGADAGSQKVTKTGLVVGTPEYMSPEQLSGDQLDGRSDLYSMALVFYRMVTGTLPFTADSAQETMVKRLTDDPMPLAQARPEGRFPPGLQAVMDRALARWPADRYASAAEFSRDVVATVGSLTGTVDTEGATQMVKAGAGLGTVPATRVATAVAAARKSAGNAAASGRADGGKRFPMVPVAVSALVLALGGGAYAARGMLFHSGAATGNIPQPGDSTKAAGGTDTQRLVQVGHDSARNGGGTTTRDSFPAHITPFPPPPPAPGPGPRDTARTIAVATKPDTGALHKQLDAIFEDLDIEAKRGDARRRALAIYDMAAVPAGVQAEAAQLVGQAYLQDGRNPDARDWYAKAIKLNPKPSWQTIYEKIPH